MGLYELVTAGDTRVANQLTTDQGVVSAAKASIIPNANILGQNDGTYPTTAVTKATVKVTMEAIPLTQANTVEDIGDGVTITIPSAALYTTAYEAGEGSQLSVIVSVLNTNKDEMIVGNTSIRGGVAGVEAGTDLGYAAGEAVGVVTFGPNTFAAGTFE
jgi:hypothetical protein